MDRLPPVFVYLAQIGELTADAIRAGEKANCTNKRPPGTTRTATPHRNGARRKPAHIAAD